MSYPGIAPCGHRGETIIGTFVRCLEGCDDNKPKAATAAPTSAALANYARVRFAYSPYMVLRPEHLSVAYGGLLKPAQGLLENVSPSVWSYTPTFEEVSSVTWVLCVKVHGQEQAMYVFKTFPEQGSWAQAPITVAP